MRKGYGLLRVVAIATAVILLLGTTAFADGRFLKRGKKGSEVEELQSLLKEKGYYDYDEITGYFGKITEDAVKDYQRDAGLKVDGMVGDDTWDSLKSDAPTSNSPSTTDSSYSEGMEGENVRKIQERLKELGIYEYDRVTGYYGHITERAVKSFQRAYDLEDDGVVGQNTWKVLFSSHKETSLIPGMKGDDVKQLQERLKELGYYTYDVDSAYGRKTKEAVEYFQRSNNLTADGIAGVNTKEVLYSDNAIKEIDARRNNDGNNDNDNSDSTPPPASGTAAELLDYADNYLGKPYVYAANGPDSFDCTGFTCYVFKHFGYNLPRTAYDQGYSNYGTKIKNFNDLQPGDLVFFNTNTSDGDLSDHAGIYMGDGKFIHASSGSSTKKVVITDINKSSYYTSRFSWGRRVLN